MGSSWGEIVLQKESANVDDIKPLLERLRRVYVDGQKLANLYGGATVIRLTGDSNWAIPIDINQQNNIDYSRVYDKWEIYPDSSDLTIQVNPHCPEYYTYTIVVDGISRVGTIHKSRIIRFRGDRLPPYAMIQNQYWDMSLLQSFYEPFFDYYNALKYTGKALKSFSLPVIKKKNLIEIFGQEYADGLNPKERLSKVFSELSSEKGVALDSETEELSFLDRGFTGIDSILAELKSNMVSASGLTKPQLLKEHPNGLSATGESERLAEAQQLQSQKELCWGEQIRVDIAILLATIGIYDGYDWQWVSGYEGTPIELSNLKSIQATIDEKYINLGVLTTDEVRQSRFGSSKFSLETTLQAVEPMNNETNGPSKNDDNPDTVNNTDTISPVVNTKFVANGKLLPLSFYDQLLDNLEEVEVTE